MEIGTPQSANMSVVRPRGVIDSTPRVSVTAEFPASIQHVWATIGTFCSVQRWQRSVNRCILTETSEGIIRIVVMDDSTAFVERLEELSNSSYFMIYSIITAPLAVSQYVAKISVEDVKGHAAVTIAAWYQTPCPDDDLDRKLSALFKAGLDGMRTIITASD